MLAGNRALAVQAAKTLEAAGKLGPDGRLLLLGEAFRTKKWREASTQLDGIEKDEIFGFLAPVLRAWAAHGSGKGSPFAALQAASANPLAKSYVAEHRAMLLLAGGDRTEGVEALRPLLEEDTIRSQRLRIAAAALLDRKGDKAGALALLEGDAPPLAAGRARLAAGKRLDGEIRTAGDGAAELLVRLALELNGQEVPHLALTLTRMATFMAPEIGAHWLVAAELLSAQDRHVEALAVLGQIGQNDPFHGNGFERRVAILIAADRSEDALKAARAVSAAQPQSAEGWTLLGDTLTEVERFEEAADAYGKAVELVQGGAEGGHPLWGLWLLRGSALTQAGRWPEGKAALEQAHKLSPRQAVVLNHLGYSQLERRENLAEAERLIRDASELQPDDAAITDSLGWAHYVRGDLYKAVELLERAAQGQPSDTAINEHLGDAYYSAGRRFEARYAWQAALTYAEGEAAERLRAKIESGLRPDLAAP